MPIKRPTTFRDVISRWKKEGAPCPRLAEDMGEIPDTVYHWWHNDAIPAKKWSKLIIAGKEKRYGISAQLLVDIASEKE